MTGKLKAEKLPILLKNNENKDNSKFLRRHRLA